VTKQADLRRESSHAVGVSLVSKELTRRGYAVSPGDARSGIDLEIRSQSERTFWIAVTSLWKKGTWWPTKKPLMPNLFSVLVLVGDDDGDSARFFILTQNELNDLIDEYQSKHPGQKPLGGFSWPYPLAFVDSWSTLPSANS